MAHSVTVGVAVPVRLAQQDAGAPHLRARVFVVAERGQPGKGVLDASREGAWTPDGDRSWATVCSRDHRSGGNHAHTKGGRCLPCEAAAVPSRTWATATASNPNELEDPRSWAERAAKVAEYSRPVSEPLGQQVRQWYTPRADDARGPGPRKRDDGKDYGLSVQVRQWSTPSGMAGGQTSRGGDRKGEELLGGQVRAWPTATAGDAKASGSRTLDSSAAHAGTSLTDAVRPDRTVAGERTWPTATTQDGANNAGPSQWRRNSDALNVATATAPGKRLNPEWVECLMGYPVGWTEPDGDSLAAEAHAGRDQRGPFSWPRGRYPEGWDRSQPWPGYAWEPSRTLPDGPPCKGRPARLRALGNAVVPRQGALALRTWGSTTSKEGCEVTATLLLGDCLDHIKGLDDNSIDAVVTDPPYGLSAPPDVAVVLAAWMAGEDYDHSGPGFMGREWDSFVPGPRVWREVFRVLKPGGHAVVFAGTRTVDLMGISVRLAGFEVRDCGQWCYWSGFPKSLDLSKEMDRLAGAEREGSRVVAADKWTEGGRKALAAGLSSYAISDGPPATPNAHRFNGYGTALKPAVEPWLLLRKPISEGSIARNAVRWGTGGLNIDACRFAPGDPMWPGPDDDSFRGRPSSGGENGLNGEPTFKIRARTADEFVDRGGRFPANLIHSPKASRAERELGCEGLPARTGAEATHRVEGTDGLQNPRAGAGRTSSGIRNFHPTVKPIALMRWLVRLVMPPGGGVVLDPFMGSGTTGMAAVGQGFDFVGMELEPDHMQIARARIEYAAAGGRVDCELKDEREDTGQTSMF